MTSEEGADRAGARRPWSAVDLIGLLALAGVGAAIGWLVGYAGLGGAVGAGVWIGFRAFSDAPGG